MGENSRSVTQEEKINSDQSSIVRTHAEAQKNATSDAEVAQLIRNYEVMMASIRKRRDALEKQRDFEISKDRYFNDTAPVEGSAAADAKLNEQRREDEGERTSSGPAYSHPADAFMAIWFDSRYTNQNKFETGAEAQAAIDEVLAVSYTHLTLPTTPYV